MSNKIQQHSIIKSLFLHLIPGLLGGLFYFLIVPVAKHYGFPTIMALIISGIFVLLPIELGILFYQSRKKREKLIGGIIKYQKPIKFWYFILWVIVIFLLTGLTFKAFDFASNYLMQLFSWIPTDYMLDMGLNGEYSKPILIITYVLFFFLIVLIIPTVEELYFRGYLLPRMPSKLKGWVVPIHSALFALYHTWSPWLFLTRTFGVLPLIYFVRKKENVYLGIVSHCIINSIDFVIGLVFIYNL